MSWRVASSERSANLPISEAGFSRLVGIAYAASHLREEGEYIRTQLYVPPAAAISDKTGIHFRFSTPVLLSDPDALRKVGAACPLPGQALVISERDGNLVAAGTVTYWKGHDIVPLGGIHFYARPFIPGGNIAIQGPGHIAAFGPHPPIELKAGRIRSPIPLHIRNPHVEEAFFVGLRSLFGDRWDPVSGYPNHRDRRQMIPYVLAEIIQRIITKAVAAGRGGTLLFVSNGIPEGQAAVKYPLQDVALGRLFVQFWDSCFESDTEQIDPTRLNQWRTAIASLLIATDFVSDIASIDGAVILDFQLNVLGFGAKLSPPVIDPAQENIAFIDGWSGKPFPELPSEISKFGTRHLSAYRFCLANPHTVAIVISQDGDVRIFVRRAETLAIVDLARTRLEHIDPDVFQKVAKEYLAGQG